MQRSAQNVRCDNVPHEPGRRHWHAKDGIATPQTSEMCFQNMIATTVNATCNGSLNSNAYFASTTLGHATIVLSSKKGAPDHQSSPIIIPWQRRRYACSSSCSTILTATHEAPRCRLDQDTKEAFVGSLARIFESWLGTWTPGICAQ